jgi:hypothetical protein
LRWHGDIIHSGNIRSICILFRATAAAAAAAQHYVIPAPHATGIHTTWSRRASLTLTCAVSEMIRSVESNCAPVRAAHPDPPLRKLPVPPGRPGRPSPSPTDAEPPDVRTMTEPESSVDPPNSAEPWPGLPDTRTHGHNCSLIIDHVKFACACASCKKCVFTGKQSKVCGTSHPPIRTLHYSPACTAYELHTQ